MSNLIYTKEDAEALCAIAIAADRCARDACVVKLDDETWAKLHELNGDAWLDEGHRELVIDTMLNYALPHYQERAKDGFC